MNPQLAGVEAITGTYVFDLRVSNRALKLNRFLWNMIGKPWRERFEDDPELLMTESGLNDLEKRFVRDRDWRVLPTFWHRHRPGAVRCPDGLLCADRSEVLNVCCGSGSRESKFPWRTCLPGVPAN